MQFFSNTTISVIVIAVQAAFSGPCTAVEPVTIRLRQFAPVSRSMVHLGDVAEITNDDGRTLQKIDLLEFPGEEQHILIDKSLIEIRLRLAGWGATDYRLLGPDQIVAGRMNAQDDKRGSPFSLVAAEAVVRNPDTIIPAGGINDRLVEKAIESGLSQEFDLTLDDVKVQLLRPVVDSRLKESVVGDAVRIEATIPPDFPYGHANLTVRFWDAECLVSTRTAFVDIRRRQTLLVARRTISRLTPVTESNVVPESRFVDARRDELQLQDLVGMSSRRTMRAGEVLTISDLQESTGHAASEQVIRPRDAVRIHAEKPPLKFIIPAAEALESGRVGQLIRVRNLQSGKIIIGRVVGAGEVEVLLQ